MNTEAGGASGAGGDRTMILMRSPSTVRADDRRPHGGSGTWTITVGAGGVPFWLFATT
jgi:hypothetical protein